MVVLNKIYTRTGDDGTTALGSGERVAKTDLRVEAYGTVDETNAAIGMARALLGRGSAEGKQSLDAALARIQNDLFDLGADLCVPERPDQPAAKNARAPLRITASQVKRLEDEIDVMNEALQPLRSFVLPGGSEVAAALHVARTVCRRAEREVLRLIAGEGDGAVGETALHYVNRLSDYLFVASRHVNDGGASDVLWVPGKNRD
jgi:cob(I)alamin adenosyltransferase